MRGRPVHLYLDGPTGPDAGDFLGVQYYRRQWVDPAVPTLFAEPPAGAQLTGVIAVDRERDFQRAPKPSAYAFARVARTGRLDELRHRNVAQG